jgi:hypothetical protein
VSDVSEFFSGFALFLGMFLGAAWAWERGRLQFAVVVVLLLLFGMLCAEGFYQGFYSINDPEAPPEALSLP